MDQQGYVPPPPPMVAPSPRPQSHATSMCLIVGSILGVVFLMFGCVMAAILFPVFADAREKARQTSCLSNERQLSTAALSYAQDYDERLPPPTYWCEGLGPYTKNSQVFLCPALGGVRSNYWLNEKVPGRGLVEFKKPAEAVLLFEARDSWDKVGGEPDTEKPHNESGNLAFVDGHAKWLSPAAVVEWTPTWSPLPPGHGEPAPKPGHMEPGASRTRAESESGSSRREGAESPPSGPNADWS